MTTSITKHIVSDALARVRTELDTVRRQLDDLIETTAEALGDAEFGDGSAEEIRAHSDDLESLREAAELLGAADDELGQAAAIVTQ